MPDQPLAAQFADLLALVTDQQGRGERSTSSFLLGGRRLSLSAPDDVLAAVSEPLGHLAAPYGPPDLTWHLVRRDAAFVDAVPARWTWQQQRYDDGRFDFRVDHVHGGISATDRAASVAVLVAPHFDLDVWRRPESSRPILERMLAGHGLVSVHGGTVGSVTHGVLLTAPGGSGKSSLVAASVRAGWSTTGDDFLCLEEGSDGPLLHSLYRTVKIAPDSPAWRGEMAEGLLSDGPDGKRMTMLDDIRPDCLVPTHAPVALVVPRPGNRVVLAPIDHHAAVFALVPSSAGMASDRAAAVRALSALAAVLPCYSLTLAHDPNAELAALAGLLAEHAPVDTAGVGALR